MGLVTAGPAFADPPLLNGVYNLNSEDGQIGTVTLSSTCAYDGCVAHAVGRRGYVQGDAVLNGGVWTMSVTNPVGDICTAKDQSFPADQVYTIDAMTLTGTVVTITVRSAMAYRGYSPLRLPSPQPDKSALGS